MRKRKQTFGPKPAHRKRVYDTGYGKPPENTRFKPGRSGNPKGRPKGASNKSRSASEESLMTIIEEEIYRRIALTDGNGQAETSMARLVLRSIGRDALKGRSQAQRLFTQLASAVEESRKSEQDRELRERPLFSRIERVVVYPSGLEERIREIEERRANSGTIAGERKGPDRLNPGDY